MSTAKSRVVLAGVLVLFSTARMAFADEEDVDVKLSRRPAMMQRQYSDDVDEGGDYRPKPKAASFGISVQGYYDFVSSYLKMVPAATPYGFGSTSGAGFGGMQILFSTTNSYGLEFSTGIDYLFPVNAQGQQMIGAGGYAVNSETITIFGIKVLQVGYRIPFGNFSLTPYGGIGLYYGKNVINLTTGIGLVDAITYSKLMAMFSAGVRGDVELNKNFSLNVALEGFMPDDLSTQLAQSGTAISELPGYEPELQSQMGFMGSFGFRIMGGLKATF